MRKGDFRKAAIIDAAEKLFYEKGYENTSVQDVLDELHLSKGGFYHHFESKLSLLEAICERRMEVSYDNCAAALESSAMTPCEKLNTVFSMCTYIGQNSPEFKLIMLCVAYRDKASMLLEQSRRTSLKLMRSLVDDIIRQASEKGQFSVKYPDIAGEILLNLCFDLTDEVSNLMISESDVLKCAAEMQLKQNAYSEACERLLGAERSSIVLLDTKPAGELLIDYNSMNKAAV